LSLLLLLLLYMVSGTITLQYPSLAILQKVNADIRIFMDAHNIGHFFFTDIIGEYDENES
jgi:hypothetical protein